MTCEKCKREVDNRAGLAVSKLTRNQYWCKACVVAAGGVFAETLVLDGVEERLQRERTERYAALQLRKERHRVNEKRALHKKVRKFTKARKLAVLSINRALRT